MLFQRLDDLLLAEAAFPHGFLLEGFEVETTQ
jgi:hypothetical protein